MKTTTPQAATRSRCPLWLSSQCYGRHDCNCLGPVPPSLATATVDATTAVTAAKEPRPRSESDNGQARCGGGR